MKILNTIGGRITIFLIIILLAGGIIYFMNIKKETPTDIIMDGNVAVLTTNFGQIKIELFAEKTPQTVANFKKLIEENFYDGVKFHRVIKGFMIQSGDPLTKDDSQQAVWGTGGPGYSFADEITADNLNQAGTIAMANAGPNTNGSQFFINTGNNNSLDQKHTVFGKVIAGLEVVQQIESVATEANQFGEQSRPIEAVVIETISLE